MARNTNAFKYMGIYKHFKELIESGELPVGAKLPTEGEIARTFNVSRITVVSGLTRLQHDGYITRVQGSGSFVRSRLASENDIKVVSFVTSFTGEGREGRLISGLESGFREHGYMLSVSNSHEDRDAERELLLSLKEKIRGIVLYASSSVDNIDLFENLIEENFPIVFLDRHPFVLPCASIACDNVEGGYEIGRFFAEHGHKRVAFLYHSITRISSERDRYDGFMRALHEAAIPREDIATVRIPGDDTLAAVDRAMKEICRTERNAPSAIFAVNDHLAYMINEYIEKSPGQCPENFLLAGFDDLIGNHLDRPFVTVRQEYAAMGRMAAEMLIDKIENRSYLANHRVSPIQLVHYNIK